MTASILLCEDDVDIRALVRELLESEGYRVISVENLEQARALLASSGAGLLLAAAGTANRERAFEVFRQICAEVSPQVPVVIFTAHELHSEDARELGCTDVITKPFDVDELLSCIGRHLKAPE